MAPLEYLRPKTIEEALQWMERGIPLAGGTSITPQRMELQAVIDLSDLGLEGMTVDGDSVEMGAMTRLQSIVEGTVGIPTALRESCKLEVGWNLRNIATIGGAIMSCDGRSPLLTALLALDPQVLQVPGERSQLLSGLLEDRDQAGLITGIRYTIPSALLYEQIARTPADFPIVSVVIASSGDPGQENLRIAIGGFGDLPIRLREAENRLRKDRDPGPAIESARQAYAHAGDAWASAEYRSEMAGLLVGRLLRKV
jgi:CO/xanthine dehydrogenase FAD-binding subunit